MGEGFVSVPVTLRVAVSWRLIVRLNQRFRTLSAVPVDLLSGRLYHMP